ncbi:MAG: hypothetical protein ACRDVL_09345 [Acidimicrobiia bacterium]
MTWASQIDPNEHDRFILRQRIRLVSNQYEFSLPEADGDRPGQVFCFVRQAAFKFKEDIRFYTDDTRSHELMRIKARQRFDPRARYDVTTPDGNKIGEIQKVFGASLVRSTYRIFDATGMEVATVTERNPVVAVFRRLVGLLNLVPALGNLVDFLPIPYHFVFRRDGAELGSHRRQLWKVRDVYTIDMSGDPDRTVDRRLVLAIAVGIDALQAR